MDSSPQGGRDWLNSASLTMSRADVQQSFRIILELLPLAHSVNMDDASLDREAELLVMMTQLVRVRRGVPVCMGSGRTSVHHKMHAVAHALRLEHYSWSGVAGALNNTLAFTTDFGVEYHMSLLPRFELQCLFPWAFDPAPDMVFEAEGEEVPAMVFEPEGVAGGPDLPGPVESTRESRSPNVA